jgi:hypothetical protein
MAIAKSRRKTQDFLSILSRKIKNSSFPALVADPIHGKKEENRDHFSSQHVQNTNSIRNDHSGRIPSQHVLERNQVSISVLIKRTVVIKKIVITKRIVIIDYIQD